MTSQENLNTTDTTGTKRYVGIDVMRYLVLFPIVAAHTVADYRFEIDTYGILENCGRFVVPFFFIASGYFLGRRNPPPLLGIVGLAIRLLPPFLFWLLVYLAFKGQLGDLKNPFFLIQCLAYGGPAYHLWFLPALGMSVALVLITQRLSWGAQFLLASSFYLLALATSAYKEILGIEKPFNTEVGPFFGYLFVLIGYYMSREKIVPSLKKGWIFLVAGAVIQLAEAYIILTVGHSYFSPRIFLGGTILQGIGAFTVALYIKPFKGSAFIADLGRASLGMYCCHMIFLNIFETRFDRDDLPQTVLIITLTILCATALSYAMSKVKYMDRLVR